MASMTFCLSKEVDGVTEAVSGCVTPMVDEREKVQWSVSVDIRPYAI